MLSNIRPALVMQVARLEREEGQALAEYGLILAFIAAVCVLALTALGITIAAEFGVIEAALP